MALKTTTGPASGWRLLANADDRSDLLASYFAVHWTRLLLHGSRTSMYSVSQPQ